MKKILILGFYELKEHLLFIADEFEKYGYEIDSYPLYRYTYDPHDKITEVKEHLDEHIKSSKPDIILWWFIDVLSKIFKFIKKKNPNIYYIMFNSDDPLNFNTELVEKCKIFNSIITTCKENLFNYTRFSGVQDVHFQPPGFDPNYFYKLSSQHVEDLLVEDISNYKCDISFILFNLFDDPYYKYQDIPRKQLVDDLIKHCNDNNYVFKLFGPHIFKQIYPDNYGGDIGYLDQNKLFNLSKVNLVTHPFCNKSVPITDIEMKILGSNSLLVTDNFKNIEEIFSHKVNCIVLDKNSYIDQIDDIIKNSSNYDHIRDNGRKMVEDYSWSRWVKNIHININKSNFDPVFYKSMYDLNIPEDQLWNHWLTEGISSKLCYKFDLPKNFLYDDYADFVNLPNVDRENKHKIYLHWYQNGKDDLFISKKNNSSGGLYIDAESLGTSVEEVFEIGQIFNSIKRNRDKHEYLKQLTDKCNNSPRVNINDILHIYINMVDS